MIPFVMINLDKPRKLRFGLGSMMQYEQMTGMKIADLSDEMSLEACGKLLWVMLSQDEPELTLQKVIELVDENADNLAEIIQLTSGTVRAAFGNGTKSKNAPTLTAIKKQNS